MGTLFVIAKYQELLNQKKKYQELSTMTQATRLSPERTRFHLASCISIYFDRQSEGTKEKY